MNFEELTDRELDAAVAEKVMGWKRGNPARGDMPWYLLGSEASKGGGRFYAPKWSVMISAAFEVVEAMRERGYAFCCSTSPEGWLALFSDDGNCCNCVRDTAPHAICIAALMAVDPE